MIVRVNLENVLSFDKETSISFVATKSDSLPEHVSRAKLRDDISVLKTGLIYGANGSGKSNVIKCIESLREFAVFGKPFVKLEPFKLSSIPQGISRMEVELKVGDKYYAYGVAYGKQRLTEEWLYQIGSRGGKPIFERTIDDVASIVKFENAFIEDETNDKNFLQYLGEATPKDETFLHEYIDRNGRGIAAVNEVYEWFRRMQIIFPSSRSRDMAIRVIRDEDYKKATKALLEFFGTGVRDLKRVNIRPEEVGIPDDVRQKYESDLIEQAEGGMVISDGKRFFYVELQDDQIIVWKELKMIHIADDGTERVFNLTEESDGTIRLLDFIPMLINMKTNDAVYLVDEIDRSMHPMMTVELFECYHRILKDKTDSALQLICTTHESNLLSEAKIRKDEVWFVEKDKNGASHTTSLVEFKPRQDVRRGYLMGRYGAIPFFGKLDNLNW